MQVPERYVLTPVTASHVFPGTTGDPSSVRGQARCKSNRPLPCYSDAKPIRLIDIDSALRYWLREPWPSYRRNLEQDLSRDAPQQALPSTREELPTATGCFTHIRRWNGVLSISSTRQDCNIIDAIRRRIFPVAGVPEVDRVEQGDDLSSCEQTDASPRPPATRVRAGSASNPHCRFGTFELLLRPQCLVNGGVAGVARHHCFVCFSSHCRAMPCASANNADDICHLVVSRASCMLRPHLGRHFLTASRRQV